MKRKVVVDILALQFISRDMCNEEMAFKAADQILQMLEDIGMLPPCDRELSNNRWEPEESGGKT